MSFDEKDTSLKEIKQFQNQHGKYVKLEFIKDGKNRSFIMSEGNLLYALDLHIKEHCITSKNTIQKAGVFILHDVDKWKSIIREQPKKILSFVRGMKLLEGFRKGSPQVTKSSMSYIHPASDITPIQ